MTAFEHIRGLCMLICALRVMSQTVTPRFVFTSEDKYVFSMDETEPVGYAIGVVSLDQVDSQNPAVYSLVCPYPEFFRINELDGTLALSKSFFDYTDFEYNMQVAAYYQSDPNQIATATLVVTVIRNREGPLFGNSNVYNKQVHETFPDAVRYRLAGETNTISFFALDPVSGAITLSKSLTRETTRFTFYALASDLRRVDAIQKTATATLSLDVHIDSAPYFTSGTEIQTLPETIVAGTWIHQLEAIDNDLIGNLTYKLVGEPLSQYMFEVHESGTIFIARDFKGSGIETINNFSLSVVVFDSFYPRNSASQTLRISVDVNPGLPEFKPTNEYDVYIYGNHASIVTTLSATDPDGDSVTYVFVDEPNTHQECFALCGNNVVSICDLENIEYILRLTVQADDGRGGQALAYISIYTFRDTSTHFINQDLNANGTTNHYHITIQHGHSVGTVVTNRPKAIDHRLDGQLLYEAVGEYVCLQYFEVNRYNGTVTLKRDLREDPNKNLLYLLLIEAIDSGGFPESQAREKVFITVVRNLDAPIFTSSVDHYDVSEFEAEGFQLVQLSAYDNDLNNIVYTMIDNSLDKLSSQYFYLDCVTGAIMVRKQLTSANENTFRFTVRATDDGLPSRSTDFNVTLTVIRFEPPTLRGPFEVTIPENIPSDAKAMNIHAEHGGVLGINSNESLRFELVGYLPSPYYFRIHPLDGDIIVDRSLKEHNKLFYELRVKVYVITVPLKPAYADVRINVERNVNGPILQHPEYHVDLYDNAIPGRSIVEMYASDEDVDDQLEFSMVGDNNCLQMFYMETSIFRYGTVFLSQSLKSWTGGQFECEITVKDNGYPNQKTATSTLTITVESMEDIDFAYTPGSLDTSIDETEFINSKVLDVDAVGKHSGEYGLLNFALVGNFPAEQFFSVNKYSGQVTLMQDLRFNYYGLDFFELKIAVYYEGLPAEKNVDLIIVNVNKDIAAPRMNNQDVAYDVSADIEYGSWKVNLDVLAPENVQPYCSIIGDDQAKHTFDVDPDHCKLVLKTDISEFKGHFEVVIKVEDKRNEDTFTTGRVIVFVNNNETDLSTRVTTYSTTLATEVENLGKDDNKEVIQITVIIGGVLGLILLVVLVAVGILCFLHFRHSKSTKEHAIGQDSPHGTTQDESHSSGHYDNPYEHLRHRDQASERREGLSSTSESQRNDFGQTSNTSNVGSGYQALQRSAEYHSLSGSVSLRMHSDVSGPDRYEVPAERNVPSYMDVHI